jgi:hypothetical protein
MAALGRFRPFKLPNWSPESCGYALTDYERTAIKPFLPNKPRGVPRVNDRRVLNGIFCVLRSGAPWRDENIPSVPGRDSTGT